MKRLHRSKGGRLKLLLLLIILTIIVSVVMNTCRNFNGSQNELNTFSNALNFPRDTLNNVNFININKKPDSGKDNDNKEKEDKLMGEAGKDINKDKSKNSKQRRTESFLFVNENTPDILIEMPEDKYEHLSGMEHINISRYSFEAETNAWNSEALKSEVNKGDSQSERSLETRAPFKNNKTQTVVTKTWIDALRAGTTRQGILRKRNLHWTIEMAGTYNSRLFSAPPGEMPKQRLPQAIIIGVGHCGTRALIEFLKIHPYIVPSNTEIHFFNNDTNFIKGYGWYQAQMPLSYSNQITMEKTPSYLWSERALHEISKINKKMKLIVIMKDPVARLVSMKLSHNPEKIRNMHLIKVDGILQVDNYSQALIHGEYVKYLQLWMHKYHPSQIHIIEGSEFVKNPAKEIIKLESFLGVPHFITENNFFFNVTKGFYCIRPLHQKEIDCLNDRKGREHPTLKPAVEKVLYDYYRGYNEKLFQLLGRRFHWEPEDRLQSNPYDKQSRQIT